LEATRTLKRQLREGSIYFRHTDEGFDVNKHSNESGLPIKTVEEVIEEAGETVPWVVDGLLARGL
jgi:hypothetical protein